MIGFCCASEASGSRRVTSLKASMSCARVRVVVSESPRVPFPRILEERVSYPEVATGELEFAPSGEPGIASCRHTSTQALLSNFRAERRQNSVGSVGMDRVSPTLPTQDLDKFRHNESCARRRKDDRNNEYC